ncbi:aldo/keto reductase [Streptomyces sp. NPDC005811]|uniref:aldo/keto reductase n=1 Tax=Streptomyces sp. NPDC005811 TaxID=3154565 RepID=UPI0033CFF4FD
MNHVLPAGTITIAGKEVSRLGLGTMRLTGPGTWRHPLDRDTALSVLRQAVHTHGITHSDTADAYGPHTVEHMMHEALYPYPEHVLIATKVGLLRPAPGQWVPHGNPRSRAQGVRWRCPLPRPRPGSPRPREAPGEGRQRRERSRPRPLRAVT